MIISNGQFDKFVEESFAVLPEEIKSKMNNVAILVDDEPTPEQIKKVKLKPGVLLFGLFEGVGQSRRINYGPILPDRITLFRKAILSRCQTEEEVKNQITSTLKHEIAHHFGSDEVGARKASGKK